MTGFLGQTPVMCRELVRLAHTGDYLSKIGMFLIKKSPRATIWTAGITSSSLLFDHWLPGEFSGVQAVVIPLFVGGVMLSVGICLKVIPSMLWRQLKGIAEANDLNLMEDYRKSQCRKHLNILWDWVFWPEARLRYTPDDCLAEREQILADRVYLRQAIEQWEPGIKKRLGLVSGQDVEDLLEAIQIEKPLSSDLERSREGFLISSLYGLEKPLAQTTQRELIGFSLGLYEDFCDGAYFHASDYKLLEQFAANTTLVQIKKQAGFQGVRHYREVPGALFQRVWMALVFRKISVETGRALRCLNETYASDRFSSQMLLWPGLERSSWLEPLDGAAEKVIEKRQQLIRETFGATYEKAERLLNHVFLPSVDSASMLRMAFDYAYGDRSLDHETEDTQITIKDNIFDDLIALGASEKRLEEVAKRVERAIHETTLFLERAVTCDHRSVFGDPSIIRVVRILFHTNTNRVRERFQKGTLTNQQISDLIAQGIEDRERIGQQLVILRLHHRLTWIQWEGYRDLVRQLGYNDTYNKQ